MFDFLKVYLRLIFDYAELAYTVSRVYLGRTGSIGGEHPLVSVAAIRAVDNAHVIGLDYASNGLYVDHNGQVGSNHKYYGR